MSTTIKMDFEDLRANAGSYRSESEEVNALLGRLDTLMATLLETWEGASAQAFNAQYEEIKPSITNLEELLHDISVQLDTVADAVEEKDQSIASGFGTI